MKVSPGASSVPASNEPTITLAAPAASALAMSPEVRSPPSAITGTPCFAASSAARSEEHTSELQSLMRTSYAVFCLKKKHQETNQHTYSVSSTPTTVGYTKH